MLHLPRAVRGSSIQHKVGYLVSWLHPLRTAGRAAPLLHHVSFSGFTILFSHMNNKHTNLHCSLLQLIKKIRYECIQWPAHLSPGARSLLSGSVETNLEHNLRNTLRSFGEGQQTPSLLARLAQPPLALTSGPVGLASACVGHSHQV